MTTNSVVIVRPASIEDIVGIARVHLLSWQTTYKGIIAGSYLSRLTLEGRIRNWEWVFRNRRQDEAILVLEQPGGEIVGFAQGGKSRETDLDFDAELYAIYLLEKAQGNGHGRLLFDALTETLKAQHFRSFMLWVLEDNPSAGFYQKLGGQFITRKEIQIGEQRLTEAAYGWKTI